jgi:hypothetical protein
MSQVGFSLVLHDYLTMGFDVAELCELVKFTNGEETSINRSTGTSSMSNDGDDGKAVGVERFIKHIMDAKLHWKEVDTTDIMVQDPEDPTLYGIEAMMVRGLSMGARNKKIDRYIPIEELRKILVEKLPGDVDGSGTVEATDAIMALRCAMGILELTPEQFEAADMDGSGTIALDDAITILRTAMGLLG